VTTPQEPLPLPTDADLRAALARANAPRYLVAARIRLHPSKLSAILNGRAPVTRDLAERILEAIVAVGGGGA